jgi:hypothetical protein
VGLAVAGAAIGALAIGALAVGALGDWQAWVGEWPDGGVDYWEAYCG